jgi:hypothetical protein
MAKARQRAYPAVVQQACTQLHSNPVTHAAAPALDVLSAMCAALCPFRVSHGPPSSGVVSTPMIGFLSSAIAHPARRDARATSAGVVRAILCPPSSVGYDSAWPQFWLHDESYHISPILIIIMHSLLLSLFALKKVRGATGLAS